MVARCLVARQVYLDTSFTVPCLGEERFLELVRAHDPDRVVFGSDGPWADPGEAAAHVARLPLPAAAREAILWRNAAALLRLEQRPT